jgi:CRP-like cAMP-binding protein
MSAENHRIIVSQVKNRILLALPKQELQRILPHLSLVVLHLGQVLYNTDNMIDYVHFVNSGMVSLLAVTDDGETIELGAVGSEGVMGVQAALGGDRVFYSSMVQIPGSSMRIRSEALRYEFQQNQELSRLLREYVLNLHLQVSQSAICNHSHSLEHRLCRWLLASQDSAMGLERLPIGQEFLSHTMGATRSAVMLTAKALQEAGLISYRRNGIRIIDRPGIEARACECYGIVTEKYD